MAETIEIDINAHDNTGKATKSVEANFRNLGRQISGIGSSMSNIFTRPLMDLERFLMKNSEIRAALAPAQKAWQDLGNELAVSLVPVIKDLTPALISLAGSLSDVIKAFSALPPGTKEAIVSFVGIMGALGPVLIGIGQLYTFIGSLSGAWATLSGILAPLGTTVLPAIGAGLAAISAPVWLLIGAIALLGVTIAVFGKQAWQTITDIGGIFTALWQLLLIKIDQIKSAWLSVDWGGIGKNLMQGIANGIYAGWNWVVDAARNAATAAFNAAKNVLGIRSPSVVFEGIGMNMMKGMANGISQNAGIPSSATNKAVSATVPSATNNSTQGGGGVTLVYSPMISLASQAEVEKNLLPMMRKLQRSM